MTFANCAVGALIAVTLALAGAAAGEEDAKGCVFDRRIYPEGYELCKWGTLVRCENGAWGDIGECEQEPAPEPEPGGPDVEEEPEQEQPRDEPRR